VSHFRDAVPMSRIDRWISKFWNRPSRESLLCRGLHATRSFGGAVPRRRRLRDA
jgi:hypothetical protein